MQQQSSKTIWRTYAMIHKPTIFKKQFGFSKDKPHQALHSCATLLGCWGAPRTYGEWKKKTVKRSVSQSLGVKPNDPRWTAGRVRWPGRTLCPGHEVPGKVDGWSGTAGGHSQPPKVAEMDKHMKDPFVGPFGTWNMVLTSIWSASVRASGPWHHSLELVKRDIVWKIRSLTLPLLTSVKPINLIFSLRSLSPLLTHTL